MKTAVSILFISILASILTLPAFGEDLKVYAAAALKASLTEMATEYGAATGHKIVLVFDTAGSTLEKFRGDPDATFLITTESLIASAEKAGTLKNGIAYRLGDTVAGFAVPPGSARPDISTPEKLRSALLSARGIAFSDPARGATVGTHFMKVIEALGIRDEVLRKATLAVDGVETMRLVLEKKVDLGITQVSEIVQADRNSLVGPFPKQFDLATTYSLWYRNDVSAAAKGFVTLMTSPASRVKLEENGVRPR